MRQVLTAVTAAFFLAACGTLAQPEAQQTDGITIDMLEPTTECHVEAAAVEGAVQFTASEACIENVSIPLTVVSEHGLPVFIGGVYAHNVSAWFPPSGAFQVQSEGAVIGSITVP